MSMFFKQRVSHEWSQSGVGTKWGPLNLEPLLGYRFRSRDDDALVTLRNTALLLFFRKESTASCSITKTNKNHLFSSLSFFFVLNFPSQCQWFFFLPLSPFLVLEAKNTWCKGQFVYIGNCLGKSPIMKKCVINYVIWNKVFQPQMCGLLVSWTDFKVIPTPFSEVIWNRYSSF